MDGLHWEYWYDEEDHRSVSGWAVSLFFSQSVFMSIGWLVSQLINWLIDWSVSWLLVWLNWIDYTRIICMILYGCRLWSKDVLLIKATTFPFLWISHTPWAIISFYTVRTKYIDRIFMTISTNYINWFTMAIKWKEIAWICLLA